MDGYGYEESCAKYLRNHGFQCVAVTPKSGDHGADIIANRRGHKYAIQCKYYSSPVGNSAVQQAHTAMAYYDCDRAAVMTNSSFTAAAKKEARKVGVELWDGIPADQPLSFFGKVMKLLHLFCLFLGVLSLLLALSLGGDWSTWLISGLFILSALLGLSGLSDFGFNFLSGFFYFVIGFWDLISSILHHQFASSSFVVWIPFLMCVIYSKFSLSRLRAEDVENRKL